MRKKGKSRQADKQERQAGKKKRVGRRKGKKDKSEK